jgi:hypothetical protein
LPERERKRWKRLAEQQGVVYAKTAAEAMKLNVDTDNPADREKLRPAVLDLVAGRIASSIPVARAFTYENHPKITDRS